MRKILTTSMVVGAALLVAACGSEKAANNTATDMNVTNDVMMDDMNATSTTDNTMATNAAE